jgi:SOS-response transcriptional repressor LexA
MDVTEQRREALRKFVARHGGHAAVVERFRLTQSQASYLSQLVAQGSTASFGELSAKNWEKRFHLVGQELQRPEIKLQNLSLVRSQGTNVEPAPSLRESKGVPVVGEVRAGADGYLEELQYPVGNGEGYVEYWTRDEAAYALRVRGDSMHPRYRAGEFVVVTPTGEPRTGGDVVVACHDGRKMLKQLNWMRDGEIQLLSVNGDYAPLTILMSDVLAIHNVAGSVPRDAFVKG